MTNQYTFITDPAHGWLAVPLAEIRDLGIAGDISAFSYINTSRGLAYLEEDSDALRFIKAKGIDISDREAVSQWCAENTRNDHQDNEYTLFSAAGPLSLRKCDQFTEAAATREG